MLYLSPLVCWIKELDIILTPWLEASIIANEEEVVLTLEVCPLMIEVVLSQHAVTK